MASFGSGSQRANQRYSVTALYSMAAEQDTEIEDELARCVSSSARQRRVSYLSNNTYQVRNDCET